METHVRDIINLKVINFFSKIRLHIYIRIEFVDKKDDKSTSKTLNIFPLYTMRSTRAHRVLSEKF